jgi:hypothetical protein
LFAGRNDIQPDRCIAVACRAVKISTLRASWQRAKHWNSTISSQAS